MVCIAAFIILCILSVGVGILSIFKKDIGRKYWKTFKKAWGCVWKKVRLQKCETSFKSDIKNSILSRFVIKKPKLVKPLSVGIEVVAVLIVVITVWSLLVAVKSGMALWVFGTCDVTKPSSCSLGAEVCSIDKEGAKNPAEAFVLWFTEWGDIFGGVPDRLRTWEVNEYIDLNTLDYYHNEKWNDDFTDVVAAPDDSEYYTKTVALDIFDPGCSICLQSFSNQLSSGFFEKHKVYLLPYPIQNPDGTYKFASSGVITRYMLATYAFRLSEQPAAWRIVEKLFTEKNNKGIIYQSIFNNFTDTKDAEDLLQTWLKEFGYSDDDVAKITTLANSAEITAKIAENKEIVDNSIHAKGIPTMIYNGKKHTGLFKE
ncbi:MAG: hypothetical protein LBE03_01120 [Candidatus Nomurabacteria bacterium]|jgi:hypothetical protein|nr:hypothetical protein [Candidatus Nomurabacteria bacterium]